MITQPVGVDTGTVCASTAPATRVVTVLAPSDTRAVWGEMIVLELREVQVVMKENSNSEDANTKSIIESTM